eukprot:jgi/Botrbrau1/18419/Bobra.0072s0011.2
MEMSGSVSANETHVIFCFDTLLGHFNGGTVSPPTFEDVRCPLFVSWHKETQKGEPKLRGCIGTLEAKQLRNALKDYALTSALRDRRFEPVTQDEISSLTCTVSLLHSFEQASSWTDWTVGHHGLIVEFKDPVQGTARSATFLPEVPVHESWSVQQTVDALVKKAGFTGGITPAFRTALKVTRYASTVRSLSYQEYSSVRQASPDSLQLIDTSCLISVPA